jgi:branched-subunit amino acid aminotransferase/4-amino-4-deoxychorismate lyase
VPVADGFKVWLDGRLVDGAEASVSVFDHGLTVGDGVFETLKTYGGRPFAVRRHLERLAASAAGLGLPILPADSLRAALEEVTAANALGDGVLRITVTGGPGPLGSARGSSGPTVIVTGGVLPPWPEATDVAIAPWPRNERGALAGLKTTSYGENVVALARALEVGAGEAVFGNLVGNLCEGTATNVFVAVEGRLLTPPLSAGCLAGVTRALVLECCDVAEEDLPIDELGRAEEAFLSSTTREVQAIRAFDGHVLPAAPGPLTRQAASALSELIARDLDP